MRESPGTSAFGSEADLSLCGAQGGRSARSRQCAHAIPYIDGPKFNERNHRVRDCCRWFHGAGVLRLNGRTDLSILSSSSVPSPCFFYAFSAAFGSVLPTLVASFGAVTDIWLVSSICLVPILVANMVATVVASRRILTAEERPQLSGWMWSLVIVGNSVFALWLAGSTLGLIPGETTGAFFAALIWQLVLSTILFARLLIIR